MRIKSQYPVAVNTVQVTVVPCMFRQEHLFLAYRMRWLSDASGSLTSPLSLALLESSQIFFSVARFFTERQTVISAGNSLFAATAPISALLEGRKLEYFLLADVIGSCRPRPSFLSRIVLKVPKTGGKDPKNRQGKKIPKQAYPLLQMRILCLFSCVAK